MNIASSKATHTTRMWCSWWLASHNATKGLIDSVMMDAVRLLPTTVTMTSLLTSSIHQSYLFRSIDSIRFNSKLLSVYLRLQHRHCSSFSWDWRTNRSNRAVFALLLWYFGLKASSMSICLRCKWSPGSPSRDPKISWIKHVCDILVSVIVRRRHNSVWNVHKNDDSPTVVTAKMTT